MQSFRARAAGILAAVEWNLCSSRDVYGAAREMPAAGWREPVARLSGFFYAGFLQNAFFAGSRSVDGLHMPRRHECDKAENTGYLLLLAGKYLQKTGDRGLFGLLPLVTWRVRAQAEVCVDGMLSFSDDETYLAGGMRPKVHVEDGSPYGEVAPNAFGLYRCPDCPRLPQRDLRSDGHALAAVGKGLESLCAFHPCKDARRTIKSGPGASSPVRIAFFQGMKKRNMRKKTAPKKHPHSFFRR